MLLCRICFFLPISIYFQEKMALSNNCPSDFLRKKNNFHNFFGIARHVYLLILHCSRDFEKLWWINKGGHICPPHLWIAVQNCPLCKKNKTLKKTGIRRIIRTPGTPDLCSAITSVYIWNYYLRRTLGWFLCLSRITPSFSYSGAILDSLKNQNFYYLFHLNIT